MGTQNPLQEAAAALREIPKSALFVPEKPLHTGDEHLCWTNAKTLRTMTSDASTRCRNVLDDPLALLECIRDRAAACRFNGAEGFIGVPPKSDEDGRRQHR